MFLKWGFKGNIRNYAVSTLSPFTLFFLTKIYAIFHFLSIHIVPLAVQRYYFFYNIIISTKDSRINKFSIVNLKRAPRKNNNDGTTFSH